MMHETTSRLAPTQIRHRVIGCFAGKLMGFLIGSKPQLLDRLSADSLLANGGSALFGCFNHDLASFDAFQRKQGHPSSYDIAQEWLTYHRYEDHSLSQVYENLNKGLFPPLSGMYRRRTVDPAVCWSRSHLWVFLSRQRMQWLEDAIKADAQIDCSHNELVSYTTALAFVQASVLAGNRIESALESVMGTSDFDHVSTAIGCAIDASKGYSGLQDALDSYLFNSKRKAIPEVGSKLGALLLMWLHRDGSIVNALSVSNKFGLLNPSFGAALGGLQGLSSGISAISQELQDPVLELMKAVRIAPNHVIDLSAVADEVARVSLDEGSSTYAIVKELPAQYRSRNQDSQHKKSPYRVGIPADGIDIELDYIHEPEFHICSSRMISLSIKCKGHEKRYLRVSWNVNDGASINPAASESLLHPNTRRVFTANCFAYRAMEWIEGTVGVACDSQQAILIPFALALAPTVRYDSLTLKPGTTVSADSEARSAPRCLPLVIDGQIGVADGERHDYWESDDTEGPHWLQINLPKPMRTNRILVHFADRSCHPESFRAMVSDDGATWTTIGEENGYVNNNVYELGPFDLRIKSFRFETNRSNNRLSPNVAKVSEIEIIPLGRGRNRVR